MFRVCQYVRPSVASLAKFILLTWGLSLPAGWLTDEDQLKKTVLKRAVKLAGIRYSMHKSYSVLFFLQIPVSWQEQISTNRCVHSHLDKNTHAHTQSCRNWLQLAGRWSLSFLHQCKSERLIIRRACLMTADLTLSDSDTLWYSGRNPAHLHCT